MIDFKNENTLIDHDFNKFFLNSYEKVQTNIVRLQLLSKFSNNFLHFVTLDWF